MDGHVLKHRGKVPAWAVMGLRGYLFGDRVHWLDLLQESIEFLQGKDLNQFPPLQSLESFDISLKFFEPSQRRHVAIQSAFVVAYLVEEYGYEALKKFIVHLWNGRETEQALKETFGIDYAELDRQWRKYAAKVSQGGKVGD